MMKLICAVLLAASGVADASPVALASPLPRTAPAGNLISRAVVAEKCRVRVVKLDAEADRLNKAITAMKARAATPGEIGLASYELELKLADRAVAQSVLDKLLARPKK